MILKIAQTFLAKVLASFISMMLVIITARYGGTAVRGEISLFVTNQTIIMLFAGIIGGPALVYLTSKVNAGSLFIVSYLWALLSTILLSLLILFLGFVPSNLYFLLFIVSLLSSFFSVNTSLLLGFQKINIFNSMNVLQVLITGMVVSYYFWWNEQSTVYEYIISLLISYGSLWLIRLIYVWTMIASHKNSERRSLLYYLKTGFAAQFSNLVQFLNYRLSYYFIALFLSENNLGLFSTCVILSESVWLISQSLAMVGFSKISAEKDPLMARSIVLQLFRLNILLTLIPVLLLLVIPDDLYTFVFGKDFKGMKSIVSIMLTGAFVISVQRIMSAYFSGTGRFRINNISVLIGLIFNAVLLYILLIKYQLAGVAFASTITYTGIFMYGFYRFRALTGLRWEDLVFKKEDFRLTF
ncbi:MAG: polysaccharide biosynthesis C-terminal domain-containing protein [Cytophagaceae bacterium]